MADLFVALGYEQPRLNIHKSGRELDLDAEHRLERRRAIAECKATADRIGGDELNKFVGALDAEQKDDLPLSGYSSLLLVSKRPPSNRKGTVDARR